MFDYYAQNEHISRGQDQFANREMYYMIFNWN